MLIWDFPFDIYVFSMWVRCDHFDALQCIDCHQCSGTGRSRPLCKNCFVKTDLTDRIKVKEIFAHRMRAKKIWSGFPMAKSDCVIVGTDSILAWKLALKACWKTRVKISSRKIFQKVTVSSTLVPILCCNPLASPWPRQVFLPGNLTPCCSRNPQGIFCKKQPHRDPLYAAILWQNPASCSRWLLALCKIRFIMHCISITFFATQIHHFLFNAYPS